MTQQMEALLAAHEASVQRGAVKIGDRVLVRGAWWRVVGAADFGWLVVDPAEPGPDRRRVHRSDVERKAE